ncbi:distal tail protein Dit [Clostridium felsineum]|uniref:distal tail protein Dit n=1 Tax=Clostridium felsineum TaxID=36839 RepID=UPI00098C2F25|nr:distal tail protein Dit [Clostridium felsineum]URZ16856.1 hypothetical protein CLFE_029030 [Clostridium felsineum DSM 794]
MASTQFRVWFNGKEIPSYVVVQTVETTALPSISNKLTTVPGAYGAVRTGIEIGEKTIEMAVTIIPPTDKTLSETIRDLAGWLSGDSFRGGELLISEDMEVRYNAFVDSAVKVSDLIVAGQGVIRFIVPSGFGVGKTVTGTVNLSAGASMLIDYQGTAPSYPIIEWTPSSNIALTTVFFRVGTDIIFTLYSAFNAGEKVVVDMGKRNVTIAGNSGLSKVPLTSEWLKFPKADNYSVTVSHAGLYTLSYTENWF